MSVDSPLGSSIIIIHPGSRILRLGLASNSSPKEIMNVIARKTKLDTPPIRPSFMIPQDFSCKFDESILRRHVSSAHRSDGTPRFSVPLKQVASLNQRSELSRKEKEEESKKEKNKTEEEKNTLSFSNGNDDDDVIIGNDVLRLPLSSPYNIHFPFKRGDFNLHSGIGGSLTSVLSDCETIWRKGIERELGILQKDFGNYRAVIVIPTLLERKFIKHFFGVLLREMKFEAGFVIQDHVAATFGAGLTTACVVDIGDQKTSISCVEDGISLTPSRIQLDYGGGDITTIFQFLCQKIGILESQNLNVNKGPLDADLMYSLKEKVCHLNYDECGIQEIKFSHPRLEESLLYFGDERLIAPLSLFHTELLELTGAEKRIRFMPPDTGDSEDPHDHLYLSDTSRKYTKTPETELDSSQTLEEDVEILMDRNPRVFESSDYLLPLDAAIIKSIDYIPTEDLKRKMLSCILIVGGGFMFEGSSVTLKKKLLCLAPNNEPLEIIVNAKENKSDITTWKGAAILSTLESAQELWIKGSEFDKLGQKLLREKAPFVWS